TLLLAALLLGIVNAVIRPIILILTLPLTVLTLGLFILVVNGISLALVAWVLPGFTVAGLVPAVLGSIVVGLTGWFASTFVGGSAVRSTSRTPAVASGGRRSRRSGWYRSHWWPAGALPSRKRAGRRSTCFRWGGPWPERAHGPPAGPRSCSRSPPSASRCRAITSISTSPPFCWRSSWPRRPLADLATAA